MWSFYARLIVRHSYLVLFIVTVVCSVLTVIPLAWRDLPTFTDPVIGFETRGTTLAHRFIAWENLIDETRPSRSLAANPADIQNQIRHNQTYQNKTNRAKLRSGYIHKKNKRRKKKQTIRFNVTTENLLLNQVINASQIHTHWGYGRNVTFEDENSVFLKDHIRKQWLSIREMQQQSHKPFHENYAYGGCGPPVTGYAHLVVTTRDNSSVLNFKNVIEICDLQSQLIEIGEFTYHKLCQRPSNSEEICCPLWSLPNYIALISVIVVVIGIGADDAFLYIKVWKTVAGQIIGGGNSGGSGVLSDIKNIASAGETILIQIVEESLKHSMLTMFITTLTTAVAFLASCVRLHLPDSKHFQLFQSSHPFELYDSVYREQYLFERFGREGGDTIRMPLRWVWGVKAIDNGNHMNPISTGHLLLDKTFSLSDPNSQLWLLGFCARLKAQPFYQPTLGPLLPNCFIETFKKFMSRRCIDKIDKIDRRPCCEVSRFPYTRSVFEQCVVQAAQSLYSTSTLGAPGVAGPKFLRSSLYPPRLVALVVEFESTITYSLSYMEMDHFYETVENWTRNELRGAPAGMRGGWFVSELQFYDVQRTLAGGTVTALALSAGLGFLVLVPATLSPVVSVCALLSIIFSCMATVATLAWAGWHLNILESVAVSTSAGLAVDFSLHYALSYTSASGSGSIRARTALSASAGPTAAAALTTAAAGVFLLSSNLLPYSQIGTFLALITSVSWVYGTFFLCSVLYCIQTGTAGSQRSGGAGCGATVGVVERNPASRVSSVCSALPQLESHELEQLADSGRTNITQDRSPSTRSASTLLLHDESLATHRLSVTENEP
ncbi:Protein dispatched [Eumeta japonica]|uniref:Protein dispatched n=1 Tax=Eumeta variegata TaxID=151549 RepID=A0A4C1WFH0_EUMVA|nr:Protein dispatched [Eumeta japonica]